MPIFRSNVEILKHTPRLVVKCGIRWCDGAAGDQSPLIHTPEKNDLLLFNRIRKAVKVLIRRRFFPDLLFVSTVKHFKSGHVATGDTNIFHLFSPFQIPICRPNAPTGITGQESQSPPHSSPANRYICPLWSGTEQNAVGQPPNRPTHPMSPRTSASISLGTYSR